MEDEDEDEKDDDDYDDGCCQEHPQYNSSSRNGSKTRVQSSRDIEGGKQADLALLKWLQQKAEGKNIDLNDSIKEREKQL